MKTFNKESSDLIISDLTEISRICKEDLIFFGNSSWTFFGGSGFVGRWITSSLMFSSNLLGTEFKVTIVTRNKSNASKSYQEFMQSNNFEPKYISVDEFLESKCNLQREQTTNFYVFGATPTTNLPNNLMTVERYFRQIMEKVTDFDNPPVFMNLSSGAVYRNAFGHQRFLFEDDEMQLAGKGINLYQDCKISIENLLTDKTKAGSIRGVNPRLFTFAGPGFPLNSHFAVSNFIMSCLNENEVCIAGHPKTSRSYMDPVDMVSWLLKLLRKQEEVGIEPVHIGSDSSIYMDELAEKIRKIFGGKSIRNTQIESAIPNSYVPSTIKTREMLGVTYNWNLDKTLVKWHDYINANRQIKESFWE